MRDIVWYYEERNKKKEYNMSIIKGSIPSKKKIMKGSINSIDHIISYYVGVKKKS